MSGLPVYALTHVSPDSLFEAFNAAFADYERSWTREEFERMLQRRGFDPALSFGAFDKDKLVSFTLNGTGLYHQAASIYDTGTGTLEAYRGQGLAQQIFRESLPALQQSGAAQYVLEVLETNKAAIAVYEKLGFHTSRKLDYYLCETKNLQLDAHELPGTYPIHEALADTWSAAEAWCESPPSWQNRVAALQLSANHFKAVGLRIDEALAGLGIIEPETGDVPLLAVDPAHRRKGIGSALLQQLQAHNRSQLLKFINIDARCISMHAFLAHHGISRSGVQLEMRRALQH